MKQKFVTEVIASIISRFRNEFISIGKTLGLLGNSKKKKKKKK